MSGIFKDKVPFEDFLKLITPTSLWYPMKKLTDSEKAALLASAIHKVSVSTLCRHPNHPILEAWRKAGDVAVRSSKLYSLVHIIPFLLFKSKKETLSVQGWLKLLIGIVRSLSWIGGDAFIAILWLSFGASRLEHFGPKWGFISSGMAACAIFFEHKSRWSEFSMTVFPRLFESWRTYFTKQKLWVEVPYGLNMMLAFSFGFISTLYNQKDQECIKRLFRWLVKLILGTPVLSSDREQEVYEPPVTERKKRSESPSQNNPVDSEYK